MKPDKHSCQVMSAKVAVSMGLLAFILLFIGLVSPFWLKRTSDISPRHLEVILGVSLLSGSIETEITLGLWEACYNNTDGMLTCGSTAFTIKWLDPVRELEVLGMILAISTIVITALFITTSFFNKQLVAAGIVAVNFLTCLTTFAAVAMFSTKMRNGILVELDDVSTLLWDSGDLSWSFAITCAGSLTFFVSGLIAIMM